MVPIYDSDVAAERWSKAEWGHYELWEKVEHRIRRHNRLWIVGTVCVFLLLSSIPIVLDQKPRWGALAGMRTLAQEISHMEREAAVEQTPYRIRFPDEGSVSYVIEKLTSCNDPGGTLVRTGSLIEGDRASQFRVLSRQEGVAVSVPGLLQDFCYDPLQGSSSFLRGESSAGFAMAPVKDLAEGRLDRIAILLLSGPTGEPSFE